MKKYNKIITLCLCVSLAFGITACGSRQKENKTSKEISKVISQESSQKTSQEVSQEVSTIQEKVWQNLLLWTMIKWLKLNS